ncbi:MULTISPECIES: hypothetical protein [unclassified Clostridium]|uniref:hypothetical protein n=1 Tax=unclassified Clostridium TaxID=2614128 RepID=UPI0003184636|nr:MULTISPECIES: hypothetical protein [unclassified Clostridium]MCR1272844.1 hypothetical protein [Clostridium botulinum]
MKNLIKRIINNKEYKKILKFTFILYIFRINYIKRVLFENTSRLTFSQYGLLFLTILGATVLAGTLIFIGGRVCSMFYARYNVPKVKGKEWSFGFGELKYFLVYKKNCKICGTKMRKITSEEYKGIVRNTNIDGYVSDVETYEVKIFYYCSKCNKKYSLEELAMEIE